MRNKGFTLVELSIVLVIIGLLIGGILVAQSMIQTAKVQIIIKDLGQYESAVNNFLVSYKHVPGDDPFFEPAGNNDGFIDPFDHSTMTSCNGNYGNEEAEQFWAHMSQSQMVKEQYVPYRPTWCDGSGNDSLTPSYAGFIVSGPVSAYLKTYAGVTTSDNKSPIFIEQDVSTGNTGVLDLMFFIDPFYVLPLESKLPFSNGTNQPGLSNMIGPHKCYDSFSGITACNKPAAKVGGLMYNFIINN